MDKRNIKGKQPNSQNMGGNLDLSKASDIECDCGNDTFALAFKFKKLSAIASPTGTEQVVPIQVFKCRKCGLELDMNKSV